MELQNTGPYFKVLYRSGSVARQSRQVFKERERYKTYKYKTDIEGHTLVCIIADYRYIV